MKNIHDKEYTRLVVKKDGCGGANVGANLDHHLKAHLSKGEIGRRLVCTINDKCCNVWWW